MFLCWRWTGRKDRDGYGRTKDRRLAHVAVYEAERGPVPEGRVLDHLCRRRDCVNPAHLEPVTQSENERRKSPQHLARMRTCAQGHDMSVNAMRTETGGRLCRECNR